MKNGNDTAVKATSDNEIIGMMSPEIDYDDVHAKVERCDGGLIDLKKDSEENPEAAKNIELQIHYSPRYKLITLRKIRGKIQVRDICFIFFGVSNRNP